METDDEWTEAKWQQFIKGLNGMAKFAANKRSPWPEELRWPKGPMLETTEAARELLERMDQAVAAVGGEGLDGNGWGTFMALSQATLELLASMHVGIRQLQTDRETFTAERDGNND